LACVVIMWLFTIGRIGTAPLGTGGQRSAESLRHWRQRSSLVDGREPEAKFGPRGHHVVVDNRRNRYCTLGKTWCRCRRQVFHNMSVTRVDEQGAAGCKAGAVGAAVCGAGEAASRSRPTRTLLRGGGFFWGRTWLSGNTCRLQKMCWTDRVQHRVSGIEQKIKIVWTEAI
jgi:hypothetical protein